MKRQRLFPVFFVAGAAMAAYAFDIVWINTANGLKLGVDPQPTTTISYTSDKSEVQVANDAAVLGTVPTANVKDITFGQTADYATRIILADDGATTVECPTYFMHAEAEYDVNPETGVVTIRCQGKSDEPLIINASGKTSKGQIKIYCPDRPVILNLDNVDITNPAGSAINLQVGKKGFAHINLAGANKACDSKEYSTPDGEKEKGAIYCTGELSIRGNGSINVTGKNKHAICSDGKAYITGSAVEIPRITIDKAKSDGLHCASLFMDEGEYVCAEAKGDGIDADTGTAEILGGMINITVNEADAKGITADAGITLADCSVAIDLVGDQSKGLRTKGNLDLASGELNINLSGNAVVTDGDPSYCTGIKVDGDFTNQNCFLKIISTGTGARGISSSGLTTFAGGRTEISVAGSCVTYADVNGVEDSYSSNCVSCDSTIVVSGGKMVLNIAADAGKGLKADLDVKVKGGEIEATASGNVFVLNGDPAYCAAIKTGDDFKMEAGKLTINHSGKGGKGVSSNGKTTIEGGEINISCTGDGIVYKDASNNYDTATPACITSDKKITLEGGTFTLKNSGSAGKCVKGDKKIEIGAEGAEGPTIYAETSGQRVSESSASAIVYGPGGPGGGWGPGGGGFNPNGDYANPKCFKADEDLTVYSGTLTLKGSTEGGEGLESKTKLTINGGTIDISTVDDCINAATNITINGGMIRCQASNNDGIDSNGTININGGTVISIGARAPEEGFDCDNNTFTITGGTLIGLGGATSTPTSSTCTQRVALYNASFTNGTLYTVCDPSGEQVLSFKSPTSVSGVMLISSPKITNNGTYTIYTGGTLTGGKTFRELTTGAAYTPGTQAKTFTPSSMITTVR